MAVFTYFEPILPPELAVNIIENEYMSIFIFKVFDFFHFRAFLGIFGHFWAFCGVFGYFGGFSGDLGDFGSASEL